MSKILKDDPLKTALVGDFTSKTDERIDFFGLCDMLSSYLMELTHYVTKDNEKENCKNIVNTLSKIMGVVAGSNAEFNFEDLEKILNLIEEIKPENTKLDNFVLPGITLIGAKIHIVRTIARRCELGYAKIYEKYGGNEYVFEYLNKLSLYLYYLALSYDKGE